MIFSKKQVNCDQNLSLVLNNEVLEQVKCTKFLGLYIDQKLTWEEHTKFVRGKISSGIYAMNMSKHVLSPNHLKQLYYSLVHPYLIYGNLLWGNTYQKHTKCLEVLQNKALHIINKSNYNESATPIFAKENMLKLPHIHEHLVGTFMFKYVKGKLPIQLQNIFTFQHNIHQHNTRHAYDLRPPKVNTDLMKRSFLFYGPKLWMNLEECIKMSTSETMFKNKMKYHLIENYETM